MQDQMQRDEIRETLREFMGDNYLFGDTDRLPGDEESLLEKGVVDSTGILELIEFLEDRFGIEVAESETVFENLGSIGGLTRFVLAKTGAAQPATWRFNMVGHLRGQAGYSLVKVQIRPDGSPFVDPKKGGPFDDRNNLNKWPQLDVANVLDPDGAAWQVVLNEGYARKYAPSTAVSWKLLPSDRLKRTVMTFNWNGLRVNDPSKTVWMVDTSIDPMTGELVENAAFK